MTNKLGLKITSTALLFASWIATTMAAAGNVAPVAVPTTVDIPGTANRVMDWGFGVLIILAALFILYAAFMYLTAQAIEGNLAKAKNYILYAIIAIVVAFVARASVGIITSLLTNQ
jgi:hypothetical protein